MAKRTTAQKQTKSRRWWGGGSEKETCSPERGFLVPVLYSVSCYPMLTLGTNPGGKRRGSCWTRRATLPPFCPVSLWRSRRCWGCHPANLENDWKKKSSLASLQAVTTVTDICCIVSVASLWGREPKKMWHLIAFTQTFKVLHLNVTSIKGFYLIVVC